MQTDPRRLRARLEARIGAWVRRRQGPDRDPVRLVRGRLYILPTRLGIAYAAMVVAMVAGGLNYGNNLALGLAFLLASLGLVAMHHCHATLAGLEVRLLGTVPAHVGQQVRFRLRLDGRSPHPRPQLEVSADGTATDVVDVGAGEAAEAMVARPALRRGRLPLERCMIATRHPLGLFRAWAVLHPDYECIAWPRPAERGRPPPGVRTDTGGAQDRARGDDDFAGLRPYQPGDPRSRIAWKAYARGQGLHVRQLAGTDVVSHVFDWDSLEGLDAESRLAQLTRWVLDAHDDGEAWGLRLPGFEVEANLGTAHLQRCLDALALHGEDRR
ncbi:MAG: DUF58 domain-containing protein [Steroidobacteraceae bacterium]